MCNLVTNYPYLLHKIGFVDSQTHTTVVAKDKHFLARAVFEIGFTRVSDLRIYVRHIKMELAAEACNFNIHTSSRPSNYGLFMALN